MEALQLPGVGRTLKTLLRADLKTQLKNRRALLVSCILPLFLLSAFKPLAKYVGVGNVVAMCMTYGILSIGLMTFPLSFVKDRERNIFQRLRVMPVPSWCIITSRLLIQVANIALVALVTTLFAQWRFHVQFTPGQWILGCLTAMLCGAVFLALGQAIAGLIKNPEVVSAVVRMLYGVLVGVSAVAEQGVLGEALKKGLHYSPYGAGKNLITWAYGTHQLTNDFYIYLALSIGYLALFSGVGFRWFRWINK